jgi:hypothetical protein
MRRFAWRRAAWRQVVAPAVLVAAGSLLAACGVPLSNAAQPLPKSGAPKGLLEHSPSTTTTTQPSSKAVPIDVFFFDATMTRLVRTVAQEPPPDNTQAAVGLALGLLTYGPTAADNNAGYQTALSTSPQATPSVRLNNQTGLASVSLDITTYDLYGPQATEAFAQIVYTITQFDVKGVVFTYGGAPVSAPLVDGGFTTRPVTRHDYATYAPLVAKTTSATAYLGSSG